MNTHNLGFYEEISKIIPLIIIKYAHYLFIGSVVESVKLVRWVDADHSDFSINLYGNKHQVLNFLDTRKHCCNQPKVQTEAKPEGNSSRRCV